jgi:hypothetical protein
LDDWRVIQEKCLDDWRVIQEKCLDDWRVIQEKCLDDWRVIQEKCLDGRRIIKEKCLDDWRVIQENGKVWELEGNVEEFDSWYVIHRLRRNFHELGRWNLLYIRPKMRNACIRTIFFEFIFMFCGIDKAHLDSKLLGRVTPQQTLTCKRHTLVSNAAVPCLT